MEATVRLQEDEPTVAVNVFFRGVEFNLLRAREEPVARFLQRLGINCNKLLGRQGGGDKKRAKKEFKKGKPPEAVATAAGEEAPAGGGPAGGPRLLDASGAQLRGDAPVGEALLKAAHMEIEGERVPIVLNPPSITKLEAFGKPLVGCPIMASLRCEFCKPEDFDLRWLRQATAGACPEGEVIGEGRIFWVPEDLVGQTITLRADAKGAPLTARPRAVARLSAVEEVPTGWPEERLRGFERRADSGAIRVVCYNILAVYYARTQLAVRDMYPYCPPGALDLAYRQPLQGRELARLDGDLVFLQECSYAVFSKCLLPLFGQQYDMRISLKASRVSEGCAMFIRRDAFEVLAEREVHFKTAIWRLEALRPLLREVHSKWPDFVRGILPKMTTVFQISAVRHKATGEVLVLANTHLFFHPLARHLRLLQMRCLLQEVQEMRERHRGANADRLPRAVVAGDLNTAPGTGVAQLIFEGHIPSDHPDWDCFSQFAWRRDEDAGDDEAPEEGEDAGEDGIHVGDEEEKRTLDPIEESERQPGRGVALTNPLGPMRDAYAGTGLAFTNYVKDFNATLDYILLAGDWNVAGCLPGISEEVLRPDGGLPNAMHPSDHLSIAADLEMVRP